MCSDFSPGPHFPRLFRHFAAATLLAAAFLSGCAHQPVDTGPPALDVRSLPASVHLTDVPFYPQETDQCGPAALAMLLTYEGAPESPLQLTSQVYTPALKGSLELDLVGAVRKAGRIPYHPPGELRALLQEVASGHPVILLQDVGEWATQWHYAVLVGYNLDRQELVLRSGNHRHMLLSFHDLERTWRPGNHWALLAIRPEDIPVSAKENDYLSQVAETEQVRPRMARTAYLAALNRWPNSLLALMGLGNLAFSERDYRAAAFWFERATDAHPESGDAYNNLAESLMQLHQWEPARQAIEKALTLGGEHDTIYQSTWKEWQNGHRNNE